MNRAVPHADKHDMAKRRPKTTEPPDPAVTEAVEIIRSVMVNRDDRWGTYRLTDKGKPTERVIPTTAPSPRLIAAIKNKGGRPLYLGPEQLTPHLRCDGYPVGVHAISTADTCKWIAWDIDHHHDDIPPAAPVAAAGAIQRFVRRTLGLHCITENSGRGGWHVWAPLNRPVRADQAYRVARVVRVVGELAWAEHDFDPRIDLFPTSDSHASSPKACGGGWLRLPGHHHKVDHVSSVYAARNRWVSGLEVWPYFRAVAKDNTAAKWRAAMATVRSIEETQRAQLVRKPRVKANGKAVSKATSKAAEVVATALRKYRGWSVERLTTTPLKADERRRREMAIIDAILPDGSLDDTEQAIMKLYAVADGNSKDLADPARRAELLDELPDTVRRLAGRRRFEWATTEEAERVRQAFIRAAERREREERLGWSVDRFTRWLDGFYSLLRSRAEQGGYAFLARVVVRSRVKRDGTANNGYALERFGGMYKQVEWRGLPYRRNGQHFDGIKMVAPYLAYMRMLAAVTVDGRTPLRILRPAVKGSLPWLLDCSGVPIDPSDDEKTGETETATSR